MLRRALPEAVAYLRLMPGRTTRGARSMMRAALVASCIFSLGFAGCRARGPDGAAQVEIGANAGGSAHSVASAQSVAAAHSVASAQSLPSTLNGAALSLVTRPKRSMPAGSDEPPRIARGIHGAVATQDAYATDVGIGILKRGGNAVDAAVAVAFALAVTHPAAGNVGGGGFMVVRLADGTASAIDYRETAPARAHRDMYLDAHGKPTDESLVGAKAAGIPGTVAGLALAHAKFGKLPWSELIEPALRLARDGHALDSVQVDDLREASLKMREHHFAASAAHYEAAGGGAYAVGDIWRQPQLAATLEAIATGGAAAFYRGPLAARLVDGVVRGGGVWTLADLERYRAVEREPLRFDYRGHTVLTMPPPSAGGVVMQQILTASALLGLERHPWQSVPSLHGYVEAARRAYADRNSLLGDPAFVKIPVLELVSTEYVKQRVADIDPEHATPSERVRAGLSVPRESTQTTHYSVVDELGNAVANTYTLNTSFGARYVVPGTGVLLNNEMDDFAVKPGTANVYGLVQSEQNAISPGKRMLSSMSPTILVRDGAVRAVLGTPGGPTITTTVVQLIRAIVDYDQPLDVAIAAPRVHHQWLPDAVIAERGLAAEVVRGLESRGHKLQWRERIGHANCIEADPKTGGLRAVADTGREGGKAAAY
ncbi:MAG: gamma-glutamyltransferase [Myxococcales bacterium]|nr:gamma-glutamyltransferase [Myxococcales bacterium]